MDEADKAYNKAKFSKTVEVEEPKSRYELGAELDDIVALSRSLSEGMGVLRFSSKLESIDPKALASIGRSIKSAHTQWANVLEDIKKE